MSRELLRRVVNYRDAMNKIASFPLGQKIRVVEDAKFTRGVVQTAYKEIKKLGFKGKLTIIDYLCWVSAEWFISSLYVSIFWRYAEPDAKKPKKNDLVKTILKMSFLDDESIADARNMIRLWRNNPQLIEDMFADIIIKKMKVDLKLDVFQTLAELYKLHLSRESNT